MTEQEKREKVIKGLEHEIARTNIADLEWLDCVEVSLLRDALALLKAQEPRMISWQDAESMRLCWVETRFPHTISPADLIHYFDESPNITVFRIHQNAMDWPLDEYGIKWRCWNNEPTNEQMKAVKWE